MRSNQIYSLPPLPSKKNPTNLFSCGIKQFRSVCYCCSISASASKQRSWNCTIYVFIYFCIRRDDAKACSMCIHCILQDGSCTLTWKDRLSWSCPLTTLCRHGLYAALYKSWQRHSCFATAPDCELSLLLLSESRRGHVRVRLSPPVTSPIVGIKIKI